MRTLRALVRLVTAPHRRRMIGAVVMGLCALGTPPRGAAQGEEVRLAVVPPSLEASVRDSLLRRRVAVDIAIDSMNAVIAQFNTRCSAFRADDSATRTYCEGEYVRLNGLAKRVEAQKLEFNSAVEVAIADADRPKRVSIDRIYVPSPAMVSEQNVLDASPATWLAVAHELARVSARANLERTRALVAAIAGLRPVESAYDLTKLSDLRPGDILLVAPADPRRDAAGAALGTAIQGADYLVRAATELASGSVMRAAQQQAAPVSHALAFVKDVNGTLLFLDHTAKGSRILDHRAFLGEYGAREMYVARPNGVVDGGELWHAASAAARQKQSDYGLFGSDVVCSERAGIAVARATRVEPNGRLGPVDITPGDFFDRQGATGKHFAITRLRITPVREMTPPRFR